ncbi:WD40 repeat domain-containing protein [Actinomadura sp. 6N118]|uniref:WD40 repeat domain-containing protein n=1 Tax=Actinomadura sp. 6N118 TaxID=3375151 RepID=UPI0037A76B6A
MSTDLYGARVLAVTPDRLSVRIRVFVVYYEAAIKQALDLPRDPVFFLRLLWDCADRRTRRGHSPDGTLAEFDYTVLMDDAWLAENTSAYVRSVQRVAERNAEPDSEAWEHIHDFYYERHGGWSDEHRLVQADYVVRVTDPRWLTGVEPGYSWATTWYPSPEFADPEFRDRGFGGGAVPGKPRFTKPVATLYPFPSRKSGDPDAGALAFSDDGALLAVAGGHGEVVVYDTGGWTERARFSAPRNGVGVDLMWVPGRHVITARPGVRYEPQAAWDVDAGAEADVPLEAGYVRSLTGRYRVEFGEGPGVEFMSARYTTDRTVLLGIDPEADAAEFPPDAWAVAFSADESRMFALDGRGDRMRFSVLDPEDGRHLGVVDTTGDVTGFAASPDGTYLAVTEEVSDTFTEPTIRQVDEGGELVVQARFRRRAGAIAWSPDGRLLAVDLHHPGGRPSEVRVIPVQESPHLASDPHPAQGFEVIGHLPARTAGTRAGDEVERGVEAARSGDVDSARELLGAHQGGGRTAAGMRADLTLASLAPSSGVAVECLRRVAAGEDPEAGPLASVALSTLDDESLQRAMAAEHLGDTVTARAIYESGGELATVLLGRLLGDREILARAQRADGPLAASYAGYLLGGLLIASGEHGEAREVLSRACETAQATRESPYGLLPWIAVRLGELLVERNAADEEIREAFVLAQPLMEIADPALAAVGLGSLDGNPHAVQGALEWLDAWKGESHAHGCRLATLLGARIVEASDKPADHPLNQMLCELEGAPESVAYGLFLAARESGSRKKWDDALRNWAAAADTGVLPYARWAGTCQAVLLNVRNDEEGARHGEDGARHALRHGREDRLIVEIADALYKDEEHEKARVAYTMAVEGDDPLAAGRASLGLGLILSIDGRLEEAAEALRRARRQADGSRATNAAFNLSTVLTKLGDKSGAVEAARDAHDRAVAAGDPAYGRARTAERLGDKLRDMGDWAEARDAYQAAVDAWRERWNEKYPFDARWSLLYLAQMQGFHGDFEASESILRALLKRFAKPDGAEEKEIAVIAALRMALNAKDQHDLDKALPWFEKVIDSGDDKHIPTAVAHLAELYYWVDDKAEAGRYYERTLELSDDPEYIAEAAYRLGEHLAETGERDRAVEMMKRALGSGFDGFDDDAKRMLARLGAS